MKKRPRLAIASGKRLGLFASTLVYTLLCTSACRTPETSDVRLAELETEEPRQAICSRVVWFVTGMLGSTIYSDEDPDSKLFFKTSRLVQENLNERLSGQTPLDKLTGVLRARAERAVKLGRQPEEVFREFSNTDLWRYFAEVPPVQTELFGIHYRSKNKQVIDIYGGMESAVQTYATQRGYCSKTFSYDWNLNPQINGRRLLKAINEFQGQFNLPNPLRDGPKHVLVAHSFGGLVSLEAIQAPGQRLAEIEAILAIKVPLMGAVGSLRPVINGYSPLPIRSKAGIRRIKRLAYYSEGLWSLMPREGFFFDTEEDFSTITVKPKSIMNPKEREELIDYLYEKTKDIADLEVPGMSESEAKKRWIRMQVERVAKMEDRLITNPKRPYPPISQIITRHYPDGVVDQYLAGISGSKKKTRRRKGETYIRLDTGRGVFMRDNAGDTSVSVRLGMTPMAKQALERMEKRQEHLYYDPTREDIQDRVQFVGSAEMKAARTGDINPYIPSAFRFRQDPILRPDASAKPKLVPMPQGVAYGLTRGLTLPFTKIDGKTYYSNVRFNNATHMQDKMSVKTLEDMTIILDSLTERAAGTQNLLIKSDLDDYALTLNFRFELAANESTPGSHNAVLQNEWNRHAKWATPREWFETKMVEALDDPKRRGKRFFSFLVFMDRIKELVISHPAGLVKPNGETIRGYGRIFVLRMQFWGLDGQLQNVLARIKLKRAFDFDELFDQVQNRLDLITGFFRSAGFDPLALGTYKDDREIVRSEFPQTPSTKLVSVAEEIIDRFRNPKSPSFDPLFYASFFVGHSQLMKRLFGDAYPEKMEEALESMTKLWAIKGSTAWFDYGPILAALFVLTDSGTLASEDLRQEVWEKFYKTVVKYVPAHAYEALRQFRFSKLVEECADTQLSLECLKAKYKVVSGISCLAPNRGCIADAKIREMRQSLKDEIRKPAELDENPQMIFDPSLVSDDKKSAAYAKMLAWRRAQGLNWIMEE